MANEVNNAKLCLDAVQALEEQLRGARKTLINSETCIVNRAIMTAQLEYLRDNLPKTVEVAAKIVAEEETIRSETEQKRKEILSGSSCACISSICLRLSILGSSYSGFRSPTRISPESRHREMLSSECPGVDRISPWIPRS